jgi:hypothetical protein
MTEFVTIIKKYGVTGLLAVWVWTLQAEVKEMREMLVDCYQFQNHNASKSNDLKQRQELFAILPKDYIDETINKRHAKA